MTDSYELTNKALQGGLEAKLRTMRSEEGLTLRQMQDRFRADGVDVSISTIVRWCRRAGIPTHLVPAS